MDKRWKERLMSMDAGAERVRFIERQEASKRPTEPCKHVFGHRYLTELGYARNCTKCGALEYVD